MSAQIKIANNTSDVRICYRNNRAVATIVKQADGKYRVVNLYAQDVTDCDSYSEAREKAMGAPAVRQLAV